MGVRVSVPACHQPWVSFPTWDTGTQLIALEATRIMSQQ